MEPDVVNYTLAVATGAKVGSPAAAESWLNKLKDKGVEANVVSYTSTVAT